MRKYHVSFMIVIKEIEDGKEKEEKKEVSDRFT